MVVFARVRAPAHFIFRYYHYVYVTCTLLPPLYAPATTSNWIPVSDTMKCVSVIAVLFMNIAGTCS